jgi:hypothetical protein
VQRYRLERLGEAVGQRDYAFNSWDLARLIAAFLGLKKLTLVTACERPKPPWAVICLLYSSSKGAGTSLAFAAAELAVGRNAFEHLSHEFGDEDGFELLAAFFAAMGWRLACGACTGCLDASPPATREIDAGAHPITSMSACSAPAALIACRMEMMSRGPTPSAFRPSTSRCRLTPSLSTAILLPLPSSTWICVRGTTSVVPPLAEGKRLAHFGRLVTLMVRFPCAMATVEMRTSEPITMTPDCSSMITRGLIGIDLQLLDVGQQADDAVLVVGRHIDMHGRRIADAGDGGAEIGIDRGGDARGGRQIRIVQREAQIGLAGEREAEFALDDGAVGDAPGSRHAAGDAGGGALRHEAADGDRALRQRIDFAVGAEQRRDQQCSALQALGVAQRADRDVDARALGGKGRQVGRHHHGGDVLGLHGVAAGVDAQPLEHGDVRLCWVKGALRSESPSR